MVAARRLIVMVAFFLPWFPGSIAAQNFPSLNAEGLAGATILKTESYAGRALFGYINGGAELYLEYGFKKLGRQEVQYAGERFVVEIYQMAGPNEAYGIFSVQRFKCIQVDSLSPHTCLSKYQLQAVAGDCYLNIINETGSAAAQKGSIDIYRSLRAAIRPQDLHLPSIFLNNKLKPFLHNLVIVHGPLGLQNGFPDWVPFFESFPTFLVFILPVEIGSSHLTLAYTNIPCCGEIEEFARLAGYDGVLGEDLQSQTKAGEHLFVQKLGKQVMIFAVGTGSLSELTDYLRSLSD